MKPRSFLNENIHFDYSWRKILSSSVEYFIASHCLNVTQDTLLTLIIFVSQVAYCFSQCNEQHIITPSSANATSRRACYEQEEEKNMNKVMSSHQTSESVSI